MPIKAFYNVELNEITVDDISELDEHPEVADRYRLHVTSTNRNYVFSVSATEETAPLSSIPQPGMEGMWIPVDDTFVNHGIIADDDTDRGEGVYLVDVSEVSREWELPAATDQLLKREFIVYNDGDAFVDYNPLGAIDVPEEVEVPVLIEGNPITQKIKFTTDAVVGRIAIKADLRGPGDISLGTISISKESDGVELYNSVIRPSGKDIITFDIPEGIEVVADDVLVLSFKAVGTNSFKLLTGLDPNVFGSALSTGTDYALLCKVWFFKPNQLLPTVVSNIDGSKPNIKPVTTIWSRQEFIAPVSSEIKSITMRLTNNTPADKDVTVYGNISDTTGKILYSFNVTAIGSIDKLYKVSIPLNYFTVTANDTYVLKLKVVASASVIGIGTKPDTTFSGNFYEEGSTGNEQLQLTMEYRDAEPVIHEGSKTTNTFTLKMAEDTNLFVNQKTRSIVVHGGNVITVFDNNNSEFLVSVHETNSKDLTAIHSIVDSDLTYS